VSERSQETPTRKPRQARAKFTRETLIDAATQVLREQGFEAFNTNRVAEKAGISIGSLYQYFPNKQALTEAILLRHVGQLAGAIATGMAQAVALPMAEIVDLLVTITTDVYAADLQLQRVVHEQIPRHQSDAVMNPTLAQMTQWLAALFEAHSQEMRPMDFHIAADMVTHLVKDITCRVLLNTPNEAAMQAARQELCVMVRTYLGVVSAGRNAQADATAP
jgi:AcrR family transcriptional regulator